MSPPGSFHGLSPETFAVLRYALGASLFLYLPFLGFLIGGSTSSLVLDFLGRESREPRTLRLSKELIGTVTVNSKVLFTVGVLPLLLISFLFEAILAPASPLPRPYWIIPFGGVVAGCSLLARYRSAAERPGELPLRELGAGAAGLLAIVSTAFLLFVLMGTLSNPAKLPLIRRNPVFIFSWASLAEFHLFLALSFGLTGGIVLLVLGMPRAADEEPDRAYREYARSVGASLAMAGALAVPALVALGLISVAPTGLSIEVFAAAAVLMLLALAVVLLFRLFPEIAAPRPRAHVSVLYLLMFLVLLAGDQAIIGNAFQGRLGPAKPRAAVGIPEEERHAAAAPGMEKGKSVFETACRACHLFERKLIGPPLNEVVAKYKGDTGRLGSYIRDPVKVDPAYPPMPALGLNDEQIEAVVGYMTAKAEGGRPREAPAAAAAPVGGKGSAVFESTCVPCHRFETRLVGPPLNEVVPKYNGDVERLKRFISDPVKVDPAYPPMPKHALTAEEIDAVARYLLKRVERGA